MENELRKKLQWTLYNEVDLPSEVVEILINGEEVIKCYKTFRDVAVFTNKRFIFRDSQGLTGKKIEMYSLPWESVYMWSSENSGKFIDLNSEIELWTKVGNFKIKLGRHINVRLIDRIISQVTLETNKN